MKDRWITSALGEGNQKPQNDHFCLSLLAPISFFLMNVNASVFAGWLDDIGLPQYKDQFHESRVDGRMLQYLTVVRIFP